MIPVTCDLYVSFNSRLAVLCNAPFNCWSELGIMYSTWVFLIHFFADSFDAHSVGMSVNSSMPASGAACLNANRGADLRAAQNRAAHAEHRNCMHRLRHAVTNNEVLSKRKSMHTGRQ